MKQVVFLEEGEYLLVKFRIERALEDVRLMDYPYLTSRIERNLHEALDILNGDEKEEEED